jgi:hypothetical protein
MTPPLRPPQPLPPLPPLQPETTLLQPTLLQPSHLQPSFCNLHSSNPRYASCNHPLQPSFLFFLGGPLCRMYIVHIYTYTATAIPFIYSFSGNSAASAPNSTFICLWAIYIFPESVHIFPPAGTADPWWEYIIRSQTHECGNWDWGPDIPFLGLLFQIFGILSLQSRMWMLRISLIASLYMEFCHVCVSV